MPSTKKYKLTDEHRAQLKPWADRWTANALRSEPQTENDKKKVRVAMRGLYRAAGLEPPTREVFCSGPITAAIAGAIGSAIWWLRENPKQHAPLFGRFLSEAELMSAIAPACAHVVEQGIAGLRGEPPSPVRLKRAATKAAPKAAIAAATPNATPVAISAATSTATDIATDIATDDATSVATSNAIYSAARVAVAATSAATRDAIDAATSAATRAAIDIRAATTAATTAAIYAATDVATRAAIDAATKAIDAATSTATYVATRVATADATDAATRAATYVTTRAATTDVTFDATDAATSAATRDAIDAATSAALYDATASATFDASQAAIYAATRAATDDATCDAIAAAEAATDDSTAAATFAATKDAIDAATSSAIAATSAAASAATHAATEVATRAVTDAATSAATAAATDAAIDTATRAALYDDRGATAAAIYAAADVATRAAIEGATSGTVYDAAYDATYAATRAAIGTATRDARDARDAIDAATSSAALIRFLVGCTGRWSSLWNGGNQWSAWCSYLSFFRHVAKLNLPIYEKFQHYETLAIHGGPRSMHAKFWIVSDFPERVLRDARSRPHCDTGPFTRWRDGWSLFRVHGTQVPADIVENRASITVARIDAEQNIEIRRIMMELYGTAQFVRDSNAKLVDAGEWPIGPDKTERGELYRRDFSDGTRVLAVRVWNGTVEPDGTVREFWLRVHPELRPLRDPIDPNARLGEPQELTALAAVASTYGLTAKDYRLAART